MYGVLHVVKLFKAGLWWYTFPGCCNPLEVYKALFQLQHNWTRLANHFGYSQTEIDDIMRAGENDTRNQIQLFLRVWWMPDCGKDKTRVFLQRGMCACK